MYFMIYIMDCPSFNLIIYDLTIRPQKKKKKKKERKKETLFYGRTDLPIGPVGPDIFFFFQFFSYWLQK